MTASYDLWMEALSLFPGGVNSPVRASLKPYPFYVERAEGVYLYTVDGKKYMDFVLGYGPLILGHRDRRVLEKVIDQVERGWLYGTPTPVEVELARKILDHMYPGGKIRFVNSGTEATLTAVRLARGYTGRKYIVKFDGCYHGSNDYLLVSSGSAVEHYGIPASKGVIDDVARYTVVAEYNSVESVERIMERYGDDVAGVIVEPVMGNLGVIPGRREFIEYLRKITREYGSLLIFDEVITGFRLGLSGASGYYNVKPDLITLGKIIGGGFPVGAIAGRTDVMDELSPEGKVFNAGTFNAHPVTMAAGLATIEILERGELSYADRAAEEVSKAIRDELGDMGINYALNRAASMFQVFLGVERVENASMARKSNGELHGKLQRALLEKGIFIAPSRLEAIFTSTKHTGEELEKAVEAFTTAVRELGE
ncbi:MAG: glutamate-1-semialdehyde 2,1-aminomutase [Desulfurococcales archaeon]|nr:glutamate-1-semialdehyde 2,1-aminomutase [Desulfurococcales archaeon]